jgi:hypothetical protein
MSLAELSRMIRSSRSAGTARELPFDNGAVFTGKPRGGGRVALEVELDLLGVKLDHSRPYRPQTCGKVERLHQIEKKWLAAPPSPHCSANWTGSAATTTTSARTARSTGAPRRRAAPPAPKPSPPSRWSPPTTGSAATASTTAE